MFFAVWTSLVAGWLCCRLGLWRLTADRDGVHIRRMWTVTFLPWSKIERVELRRDGMLEFVGPTRTPLAGLFLPSWADSPARRRGAGS
ncbi:PH domain-containing protein, partial [Streptomyces sp. TRM76130]|nr:PH domain-containing protein [Streptomyces sp. TRM76130]